MSRILAIGIATVDIINTVADYPAEDSEVRALGQRIARGGNATNSLVVLSQLGHQVAWGGTLADDVDSAHILNDLQAYAVDLRHCRRLSQGINPTSYIMLSQANGTRSIVHHRDLPEFKCADFAAIDLSGYDWLHFEGRNITETEMMLELTRKRAPQLRVSLEIEKPRPGIERLLALPDVLLFSRSYAQAQGYYDALTMLDAISEQSPQADRVCAWGEDGAYALGRDGANYASAAFPPAQVIDTLGAGDTFNAGIIDALVRGRGLGDAVENASRLAGRKCAQVGFAGLVDD